MISGLDQSVKQFLTRYQNPDACRIDILRTIEQYKGLNVSSQSFGITYNIPICIWLMDTHPNHAPMCYVKPTSDMLIKMSKFVDHTGKIYLPYLHDWKPPTSDLLGLIQVMICTFGEYPPVYSRPRTDTSHPPYPTQPLSFMQMPYPQASSVDTTAGAATGVRPYPPYPTRPYMPYPVQQPMQQQATPSSSGMNTGTITDEHIRASLLSAVEYKLKQRLDKQFDQSKAELEVLQQTANELAQGKAKLDLIFERLNREKVELDRNIQLLKEKDEEMKESITQLKDEKEIDVDEAVTTTAPLILNAYAEEAATEDALYYLGEALRRGVIDLDVFLKQVRTLSRKQFMLRALMQKCRSKAGLAC